MSGKADWANLPKPVAYSVLDKLFESINRIRFGVVCTNWHVIAKEYKEDCRLVQQSHKNLPPMLMIPATNNHHKRRLYSIFEEKIYGIHLSVPNKICIGSGYGWLAFANHKKLVINLMNPFKKSTPIYLPPLEFNHLDRAGSSFKIKKVILSTDPFVSPDNYVVVVIYGGDDRLTFFTPGQNKWCKIGHEDDWLFIDIVFYKNILYAVNRYSKIISVDFSSIVYYEKAARVNILSHGDGNRVPRVYLVESSRGELFMVSRYFKHNKVETGEFRRTKSIKVYKLVLDATSGVLVEHVEVTSLGGDAVFIGFNCSWCVPASEFPKCIPNSIYFTNDFYQLYNDMDGLCDLGVYNMEEQSFGEHYKLTTSDRNFYPPTWVLPPV